MKPKIKTLEALRGIAALLVVMYHLQYIFSTRGGIVPFGGLFGSGDRGVDLFFVLSGFIITASHYDHIGRADCTWQFIYRRACRLFPSVWVMTLIAAVMYACNFGGAGKIEKFEPWNIVASFFLLPQHGWALVNVTWTLTYEIFFYALFAMMIANRRIGGLLLVAWQSTVLMAAVGIISWQGSLLQYYFRPICLEFGMGMGCAVLFARQNPNPGPVVVRAYVMLLILGVAAFVGALLYEVFVNPHGLEDVRFLVYGLSTGAIIFSASSLERHGSLRAGPILLWLGEASYAIYLVHYSVITLSAVILLKYGWLPVNSIVLAACALLGVAAGAAFHGLVDRPIQTRLRRFGRLRFVPDRLSPTRSWPTVTRTKEEQPS